jgi:hypothetical protein
MGGRFGVRRFIAAFFSRAKTLPKTFWSAAIHRRFLSFSESRRPLKESGVETPHSKTVHGV